MPCAIQKKLKFHLKNAEIVSMEKSGKSSDILNLSVLHDLQGLEGNDGRSLIDELVELFLKITPPKITELKSALAGTELDKIESISHSLKSSCGNLGLTRLQKIFSTAEQLASESQPDALKAELRDLDREFKSAVTALNKALKDGIGEMKKAG